jgi:hypothetical protein
MGAVALECRGGRSGSGGRKWERAKDNKDCCAVFPRSQYVARPCTLYGGVSSGTKASGPQGERFQVSLYEFCMRSATTHFGIRFEIRNFPHREESGRRFAHYGTVPLPTGMPSSSTRPRTTPPCRTWARSKIDDDRRLRVLVPFLLRLGCFGPSPLALVVPSTGPLGLPFPPFPPLSPLPPFPVPLFAIRRIHKLYSTRPTWRPDTTARCACCRMCPWVRTPTCLCS